MPIFCKDKSRLKMYALTKNGFPNITWYSPLKYDKLGSTVSDDTIMTRMLKRLNEKPVINQVQKVNFYNNKTKDLIREYSG